MRFRKASGKSKAVVTMTQMEVVDACSEYLKAKGVEIGNLCWLKFLPEKVRKSDRLQFVSEVR